jgi:glycosyltransferase involved in cell wall biosynthesis
MHLGIDVQTLQTAEATRGIGRVAANLISLLLSKTDHQLTLFGRDSQPGESLAAFLGPRCKYAPIQLLNSLTVQQALEQGVHCDFLSTTPEAQDLDLYHVTSPMMLDILLPTAVAGKRIVATIFDAIPQLWQARRTPLYPPAAMDLVDQRATVIQSYDRYLSISQCTAKDCVIFQDLDPAKITVTYTPNPAPPVQSPDEVQALLQKVGAPGNHVLCISGYNPRKNLAGTLRAYAHLPIPLRQDHPLVLVCKLQESERSELLNLAAELGILQSFIPTGYVEDSTLWALLRTARLLFFPSEYEGFGLPVTEAHRVGVPVVAADNSCLPEVVGPGGHLVTSNPVDAALAMEELLLNPELSRELGAKGQTHSQKFTDLAYLQRVLDAYHTVLSQPPQITAVTKYAIPPGASQSQPQSQGELRRKLGLPESGPVVCVLGGVQESTKPWILSDTLHQLASDHPHLVFCILGPCDRELLYRLTSFVTTQGMRHRLLVAGPVSSDELALWLQAITVLWIPSNQPEALDMARGAMAVSKAPLVMAYQQALEAWPNGEVFWMIPDGDDPAYYAAQIISTLIRQSDIAQSLAEEAKSWARQRAIRPESKATLAGT